MKHLLLVVIFVAQGVAQQRAAELNSILMESTFRIHAPKKDSITQTSFGTAFLMGKPVPDDPTKLYYVLVSAKHVFDGFAGDVAFLLLRDPKGDGSYTTRLWSIAIRDKGIDLYVKHPTEDVAVLYVNMPDEMKVTILPTSFLATDEMLTKYEIHPGDELLCLGFPLLVSSPYGFPILRSGKIASYPLTPTKLIKRILFDFNVFEGNSGGPVYFIDRNRAFGGQTFLGNTIQFVIGVESAQLQAAAYGLQTIGVAQIVPSPFIIETLALMPANSPYK